MPIKKCTKDGKSGYSWGDGACIIGPDAKKIVIRMGLKIMYDKYGPKEGGKKFAEHAKGEEITEKEIHEVLLDKDLSEEETSAFCNMLGYNIVDQINLSIARKSQRG